MAEFNLQIGIDATGAKRGASEVNAALGKVSGATSGANKGLGNTKKASADLGVQFQKLRRIAAGAFAVFAGFRAGKEFLALSDQFTQVRNRLRLVTSSQGELETVQAELIRQSKESFITLDAQAQVFQRVSKGAGEFGFTQLQALQATEALAKAVRLSGVESSAANSALVQLGQGIAAGALRGQELNSVLEQTPRVADAIADALGVPVGKLKEMGEAGAITVDKIIPGLIAQLAKLDEETKKLSPTFDEITTNIRTDFLTNVGAFNDATGAVQGFGGALGAIAADAVPFLFDQLLVLANTFVTVAEQAQITGGFIIDAFTTTSEGLLNTQEEVGFLGRAFENLKTPFTSAFTALQLIIIDVVAALKNIALAPLVAFKELEIGILDATISLREFFGQDTSALKRGIEEANLELAAAKGIQQANNDAALAAQTNLLKANETGKSRLTDLQNEIQLGREKLKITKEELAAALEGVRAGGRTGAVQTGGSAAEKAAAKAAKKLADQVTSFNEANNASISYRAALAEIDKLAAAGADSVAVLNAKLAARESFEDATGALDKYNEALDLARDITESTRTPTEQLQNDMKDLQNLLDQGLISDEVFRRQKTALEDAADQTNFMRDIAKAAAEDIQGAFRDLFLEGTDGLSDFANKFGETLQRIAANFLANQAIKFLLGENFGEGEFGGVFGNLGNLFSGRGAGPIQDAGAGDTSPFTTTFGEANAPGAFDSILAQAGQSVADGVALGAPSVGDALAQQANGGPFSQGLTGIFGSLTAGLGNILGGIGGGISGLFGGFAGLFADGGDIPRGQFGVVGEKGPELVTGPASVIGRQQTSMMGSPEVNVAINNISDPREAVETLNTSEGDKSVVNSIRRNAASIKRELGLA